MTIDPQHPIKEAMRDWQRRDAVFESQFDGFTVWADAHAYKVTADGVVHCVPGVAAPFTNYQRAVLFAQALPVRVDAEALAEALLEEAAA